MAKSSRPASAILEPERGCESELLVLERLRFRCCCSSVSMDKGTPTMTTMPRRGHPSAPIGRMTRSLNFGSRYFAKRSGGSMICISQSTNLSPSFMTSSQKHYVEQFTLTIALLGQLAYWSLLYGKQVALARADGQA